MQNNTPTVVAKPGDLTPEPGLQFPRPARLPLIPADPPPGTTRLIFRGMDAGHRDFATADELHDWLDAEYGRGLFRGWEFGSDHAGFEDYTIRDREGDVIADVEEY